MPKSTNPFCRDGRQVKYEEFCGLVEARIEEIILNVKTQITLSKYDNAQLIGGLIITGGASHLKDIDKAARTRHEVRKNPLRAQSAHPLGE